MEQETTWMRYLLLGVITSVFLSFNSCKKTGSGGYEKYPTFYIVNQTDHQITFDGFPDNYSVAPKAMISIRENQVVKENSDNAHSYKSPYGRDRSLPITIRFDNLRCLVNQTENDEHSIIDIKKFVAEKIGKYDYKFTYTFTEADYNRAVACP